MRSLHASIVLGLAAVVAAPSLLACDMTSGERKQLVFLEWDDRSIAHWTVQSSEIHRVELPNGFQLGLKVEPAPADIHAESWAKGQHSAEMLKLSLYDLGGATPKHLTSTFGGANSVQGYGAGGGADRVEQLGNPGITLMLLKPVCEEPPSALVAES